jgi:hypothetical protein
MPNPRSTGVTGRYPHETGGPGGGIAGSMEENQGVGHYETGHAPLHLGDTKRWWLYLRADVTRDPKGTPGYASGPMQQKASPVLPPEDQKVGIPEAGRTPLTLNEDREEWRIGTADRLPRGGASRFPISWAHRHCVTGPDGPGWTRLADVELPLRTPARAVPRNLCQKR